MSNFERHRGVLVLTLTPFPETPRLTDAQLLDPGRSLLGDHRSS